MILHSRELIDEYTAKGWWGKETFSELFSRLVRKHPDELALIDPPNRTDFTSGAGQRLTYHEIDKHIDALAGKLIALGANKDDIAIIQLPNIVEIVISILTCAKIGVIASPVAVNYRQHELTDILSITKARFFITIDHFKGQQLAETAQGFMGRSSLEHVLSWGDIDSDAIHSLDGLSASPPLRTLADYLAGLEQSANEIVTAAWTSGTTAEPKAVLRSHNNWHISGNAVIEAAQLTENDIFLCPFPLINMGSISGFLVPWLKIKSVLNLHHPFDLEVFLQQLGRQAISYSIAPPAILNALLKNRELLDTVDLRHLRSVASGSARLSPWMVKTYQEEYGINIINFFGSNEGIALASSSHEVPDPEQRANYFPRWGVKGIEWSASVSKMNETKLLDTITGEEITEPHQAGELVIRGPGIFPAYLNRPTLTVEAFDKEGFFHTGDVFEIAGEGELSRLYKFTDRCKDIIIRGGMNISPGELDALLAGHPKLVESAVVGYPDETLGERIAVFAVLKEGETLALEDIIAYLKEKQIAVFKLPEKLVLIDKLPRNAMNKVLRRELINFVE